jgi:Na+/H+ antiporter NhaD/arsenite permease-like protein
LKLSEQFNEIGLIEMEQLKGFIKKETVFVIAAILTIISMFLVSPSMEYLGYINFSVLAILFCLMSVVAGFQKIGVFEAISSIILSKTNNRKTIGMILVLVCFFTAMLVTNDVALITFVPFTIGILGDDDDNLIFVIVMETIAANLGSMMTPIGNPQNLFLYSYYRLDILDFFIIMAPIGIISLVLIIAIMLCRKKGDLYVSADQERVSIDQKQLLKYTVMFFICILTVLHIIHYFVCIGIIGIVLLVSDRSLLKKIDYMLLLTFICFFVFVGNVSSMERIRIFVAEILMNRETLVSAIISQFISNVPAAIMLAPFTYKPEKLLIGVNIGGLGTIIASMASLISYKYYAIMEHARKGKYLIVFSLLNFALLIILLLVIFLIDSKSLGIIRYR